MQTPNTTGEMAVLPSSYVQHLVEPIPEETTRNLVMMIGLGLLITIAEIALLIGVLGLAVHY